MKNSLNLNSAWLLLICEKGFNACTIYSSENCLIYFLNIKLELLDLFQQGIYNTASVSVYSSLEWYCIELIDIVIYNLCNLDSQTNSHIGHVGKNVK